MPSIKVKAEQKKVPYLGKACILLMQSWQDSQLARSLPLGFEQNWLIGRPPVSLLPPGTSSSFQVYIHNHGSPDL